MPVRSLAALAALMLAAAPSGAQGIAMHVDSGAVLSPEPSAGAALWGMAKAVAFFAAVVGLALYARPLLDRGPYVALGPVRHYITFSDSGVAVNERHEVLRADGTPIEGLYAAGFIGMGGMLLEGLGHHLGWAFTSGRRAGRHAAFRVVTPD